MVSTRQEAIIANDLTKTRSLLAEGVDVNYAYRGGYTALMYAAHRNHRAIMRELLGIPEIDVNYQDIWGCSCIQKIYLNGI